MPSAGCWPCRWPRPCATSSSSADVHPGELLTIFLVAVAAQLVIGGSCRPTAAGTRVGSVDDAINVTGATALVGALVFLVVFFVQPALLPRSVPLLAVADRRAARRGLAGWLFRLYREHRYRPTTADAERVIIYGAGLEGQQLLRLMLSDPSGSYLPVALLDDNRLLPPAPDLRRGGARHPGGRRGRGRGSLRATSSSSPIRPCPLDGRPGDRERGPGGRSRG